MTTARSWMVSGSWPIPATATGENTENSLGCWLAPSPTQRLHDFQMVSASSINSVVRSSSISRNNDAALIEAAWRDRRHRKCSSSSSRVLPDCFPRRTGVVPGTSGIARAATRAACRVGRRCTRAGPLLDRRHRGARRGAGGGPRRENDTTMPDRPDPSTLDVWQLDSARLARHPRMPPRVYERPRQLQRSLLPRRHRGLGRV